MVVIYNEDSFGNLPMTIIKTDDREGVFAICRELMERDDREWDDLFEELEKAGYEFDIVYDEDLDFPFSVLQ